MGRWRNTLEIDFLGQFDFPKSSNSLPEEFEPERGHRDRGVEAVSPEEVFQFWRDNSRSVVFPREAAHIASEGDQFC